MFLGYTSNRQHLNATSFAGPLPLEGEAPATTEPNLLLLRPTSDIKHSCPSIWEAFAVPPLDEVCLCEPTFFPLWTGISHTQSIDTWTTYVTCAHRSSMFNLARPCSKISLSFFASVFLFSSCLLLTPPVRSPCGRWIERHLYSCFLTIFDDTKEYFLMGRGRWERCFQMPGRDEKRKERCVWSRSHCYMRLCACGFAKNDNRQVTCS
ncbi:hypothetical protein F4808DRAFT_197704 [Astrocystis sublimbata]|nr:hypothetical protein F4808DRAFT_197704 [Astrocystis sublimbata]